MDRQKHAERLGLPVALDRIRELRVVTKRAESRFQEQLWLGGCFGRVFLCAHELAHIEQLGLQHGLLTLGAHLYFGESFNDFGAMTCAADA